MALRKPAGKIPRNAKLAYNGLIFKVYQWKQKQFDGSYRKWEAIKRPDTALVIPEYRGKIALGIQSEPRAKSSINLLGGRVEEGESALSAAKRELLEESGLSSSDFKLLAVLEPSAKIEHKVYIFAARNCRKTSGQKLDAGERISLIYVDFPRFLRFAKNFSPLEAYYFYKMMESKKGLRMLEGSILGLPSL
ncbi:MAG: NUDIX domain-containing protein [Candidatus Micrarchaeota archaeon]|nr:NUDIX domain-containing protein [Candidatus Micrarchaeota archaeon]MDE1847962.1 NUDIX domain-containing protein [Candidatus Micrarchaeota archaeon]MDE1864320.1 NUDIX domain-containing protein [Candidatus Micrarchaeota archaeon]